MYLRQSTASQEIVLGPFVDSVDGNTAETGLTIANTDIKIYKGGATSAVNKNSGGGTHDAGGRYTAVLDATDTNTVGAMEVHVHVSGALPVFRRYWVLEESVYDALFAASAPGYVANAPVNTTQLAGQTVTAATGVTFPASVGTSTVTRAEITGGAYPIQTDSGYVKVSSGNGTGQIDVTNGRVRTRL